MWLVSHPLNNALVVLVHGLWGEPCRSWEHLVSLLVRESETDARLRTYDVYSHGYRSGLLRQSAVATVVTQDIHEALRTRASKYETVVLLGHSLGGLVAMRYTIALRQGGFGSHIPVDLLLTVGTPHRGVFLAGVGRVVRVAGRLVRMRLADHYVTATKRSVRELEAEWKVHGLGVRRVAMQGDRDAVVGLDPRATFEGSVVAMDFSHRDIAKAWPRIRRELHEHLDPSTLRAGAQRSLSTAELEECVRRLRHAVGQLLRSEGLLDSASAEEAAPFHVVEALHALIGRPMRGLTLDQAILETCRRRIEER